MYKTTHEMEALSGATNRIGSFPDPGKQQSTEYHVKLTAIPGRQYELTHDEGPLVGFLVSNS